MMMGIFIIGYFDVRLWHTMTIVSEVKHALCRGLQRSTLPCACLRECNILHWNSPSLRQSFPHRFANRRPPTYCTLRNIRPHLPSNNVRAPKPRRRFPPLARRKQPLPHPPTCRTPGSSCPRPLNTRTQTTPNPHSHRIPFLPSTPPPLRPNTRPTRMLHLRLANACWIRLDRRS